MNLLLGVIFLYNVKNNNMAAVRVFSVVFSLTAVTNQPLELGVSNFIWRQIINTRTSNAHDIVCVNEQYKDGDVVPF
jgi:hypothetical protein